MVEPELLHQAQLRIVDLLKEIDRICTKHDIQWFLYYGTLLGAVRHKGFIPWDDDCDIGMMRSDYEKFISVVEAELGPEFFWQTKKSDPQYPRPVPKLRLLGTKLVEFDEDENMPYNQGLFVDIFVCDYYPSLAKVVLPWFQIMPELRQKRKKYPRGSFMRAVLGITTAIPYVFHSAAEKLFKSFCKRVQKDGQQPYISTEIRLTEGFVMKKEDVFPLKRELEFEGSIFPTANNYDACLKAIYGDYMQLPPPEKRRIHAKAIEI